MCDSFPQTAAKAEQAVNGVGARTSWRNTRQVAARKPLRTPLRASPLRKTRGSNPPRPQNAQKPFERSRLGSRHRDPSTLRKRQKPGTPTHCRKNQLAAVDHRQALTGYIRDMAKHTLMNKTAYAGDRNEHRRQEDEDE
ncbi:hypothetical protein GCM10018965_011010 [Nonomuraea roseola]